MSEKLKSDRWKIVIPVAIVLFLFIVFLVAYALKDEPSSAPIRTDRWNAPVNQQERRRNYP